MLRIRRNFPIQRIVLICLIVLPGCQVYPIAPYRPDFVRVKVDDIRAANGLTLEIGWSP
jgi:hypothetical protein